MSLESHVELILKSNLLPDILRVCKPIIDAYEARLEPNQPQADEGIENKDRHPAESVEFAEIDGLPARTALVYYSLSLLQEVLKNSNISFILFVMLNSASRYADKP